jgi:electron transport complex protein RnfA
MQLLSIFTMAILTQNVILVKFLGICPFVGTSSKEESATGMIASVGFVTVLSNIISYLIYHYLLVPYESEYLKTIVFILVIASLVQILDIIIKKTSKKLYDSLGRYLPLITTNCIVLGVILLTVSFEYNLLETFIYVFGAVAGFGVVIYVYSTLRERINKSPIPLAFKGLPIALITASIMALVFSRFL